MVEAELECLGVGDSSVVEYLADALGSRATQLSHFLPLGIYIVEQAKLYIEGCGGKTDVTYITKKTRGKLHGITPVLVAEMKSIETWVAGLLEHFTNFEGMNDETFRRNLEGFSRLIVQARTHTELRRLMRKAKMSDVRRSVSQTIKDQQ